MNQPDVLILDEPLKALDPITKHALQIELKEMFSALSQTVIL